MAKRKSITVQYISSDKSFQSFWDLTEKTLVFILDQGKGEAVSVGVRL